MRSSLRILLAIAAFAACTPGTVIVVREPVSNPRPAPRPAPAPTPAPAPLAPLEVDIGRPHRGQLVVQTNRPAYVALFEIIPDQGVTLVHPSSARERRFMISGPRRMPVWFDEARVTPAASRGVAHQPVRYIYALASDEPLNITDEAFHAAYLRRVLGPVTYRGAHPYSTMRAIAGRFAPNVRDEKWAEDVIVIDARRRAEPQHVARVYCPGGVVIEIPEEIADRAWCPGRRGGPPAAGQPVADEPPPTRPDSVKGNNGRRVQMRAHGNPGEQPRSRVRESMVMPADQTTPAPVPTPAVPAPEAEKPGNRPEQSEDRPGNRRGQDEDRPGNRRGQTEDKPGNGPPPGAGVPGTPATPSTPGTTGALPPGQAKKQPDGQNQPTQPAQPVATQPAAANPPAETGRPDNAGPPGQAGRPANGRAEPANPGNAPVNRGRPQQQQPIQEPPTQQPAVAQPSQPAAAQPAQPQPQANQPEPAAAKPEEAKPEQPKPGQGSAPPNRGQPKPKAAPDTSVTTQPAASDTASKPGKGRPVPPTRGRPPQP